MTGMQSLVSLLVGGQVFDGWTSARVSRSLDAIAGTFSLSLTERWPGRGAARPVRPFESCVLLLDGERVITGYVDEVQPSYDSGTHDVSASGRDRTADLVDCSAVLSPGEWHNASLERIASALAKPFGIDVHAIATGKRFKRFRLEEGETAFEALDRMCRMRGLLATSDVDGNVLLVRSGNGGHASVTLERGVNVLSASGKFCGKDRFSQYIVKSQQPGIDVSPSGAAQVQAVASDSFVPRYRPSVIVAEDAADLESAQIRAQWERQTRAARARSITVTVQGWRETAHGPLWMPNRLVTYCDSWMGVDARFLLSSVELSYSDQGSISTLTLIPPDAYSLLPEPDKEVSKWS